MESFIRKLRQFMDIRRSLDNIPAHLQRFYKPVSSKGYINGNTPVTRTIWIVDEDAVQTHFAKRPAPTGSRVDYLEVA